jgi:hypothetical protein
MKEINIRTIYERNLYLDVLNLMKKVLKFRLFDTNYDIYE